MKKNHLIYSAVPAAILGLFVFVVAAPAVAFAYCSGSCPMPGYTYVGGSTTVTNNNTNTNTGTNTNTNNNTNKNEITINNHIGGGYSYQPVSQPYYQQPVNTLVCSPVNQSGSLGQTFTFTASGGSGSYFWSAPESLIQNNQSGQIAQVSYGTVGLKTITVTSNGQTATCFVTVNGQVLGETIDFPDTGFGDSNFIIGAFGLVVVASLIGSFIVSRRNAA